MNFFFLKPLDVINYQKKLKQKKYFFEQFKSLTDLEQKFLQN